MQNQNRRIVLERLLENGWIDMDIHMSGNLKLYARGNERIIYANDWDRVMISYKVGVFNIDKGVY